MCLSASHIESVTIRPYAIRPLQIRLHAHSAIYKFVPMSNIRPIQSIVSLHNMRRQFIINKSQVHQHIQPCRDTELKSNLSFGLILIRHMHSSFFLNIL